MEHKSNAPALQGQSYTDQGVGADQNFDHKPRNFAHREGHDPNAVIKIQSPGSAAYAEFGDSDQQKPAVRATFVPTENPPANTSHKTNRGRPAKWPDTWIPTVETVRAVRQRCLRKRDKDYSVYKERLCQRWQASKEQMVLDIAAGIGLRDAVGDGWELDRIDNSRPYQPGNVQWVRRADNNRNRSFNRHHARQNIAARMWEVWCEAHPNGHLLPNKLGKNADQLRKIAKAVEGQADPVEFVRWVAGDWHKVRRTIERDAGSKPGAKPRLDTLQKYLDVILPYYLETTTAAAQPAHSKPTSSLMDDPDDDLVPDDGTPPQTTAAHDQDDEDDLVLYD
jgi:hypothetical protein